VVVAYDVKEFLSLAMQKLELLKKITAATDEAAKAAMKKEFDDVSKKLDSVATGEETAFGGTGFAVVIFESQTDHREVLRYWNGYWVKFRRLLLSAGLCVCCGPALPQFRGNELRIERAPD